MKEKEITTITQPKSVSLSDIFLWEVFLTPKWDNLFSGFPLPREAGGFCPTTCKWFEGKQALGDCELIEYIDSETKSVVTIGMRMESVKVDRNTLNTWHPNSIRIDIKFGLFRLKIPIKKIFRNEP